MTQSRRSKSPYPRYSSFSKMVKVAAAQWFLGKGYSTSQKYPYLLETWTDWSRNIILPEVSQFIEAYATKQRAEGKNFPLHKYIHHGLSSQAMLFNLVSPLIVRKDMTPLQSVLSKSGIEWPGADVDVILEFEDCKVFNESRGQPTSIDLVITSRTGSPVFIEAKFVEQEFGGCSVFQQGDCDGRNPAANLDLCYLHHMGRRYWDVMEKHQIHHGKIRTDAMCILAPHYQFFRELLFALERGGSFVLLSDERSPVFYSDGPYGRRGLMPFLIELLPEDAKKKVAAISIQDLVEEIRKGGRHGDWIGEFALKYGLAPGEPISPKSSQK